MVTMRQLTKEEAIRLSHNKIYEHMTPWQRVYHQVEQRLLFMPFDVFHEAADKFYPGIMTMGLTSLTPDGIYQLKPVNETVFDFSSYLE